MYLVHTHTHTLYTAANIHLYALTHTHSLIHIQQTEGGEPKFGPYEVARRQEITQSKKTWKIDDVMEEKLLGIVAQEDLKTVRVPTIEDLLDKYVVYI